MPVDFSKLLSPESRLRLRRTTVEIARLHALSDRWLGEELLRLARAVRRDFPDRLGDPREGTYGPGFCWHLVPEVAKRLGATRLLPNEATDASIVGLGDADLRKCAGTFLNNVGIDRWKARAGDRPSAAEILCHSIANGNPVALAVDRLHPAPEAGADRDDWIARHVREISRVRGFEETPYWSPALQDHPRRATAHAEHLDGSGDVAAGNVVVLGP